MSDAIPSTPMMIEDAVPDPDGLMLHRFTVAVWIPDDTDEKDLSGLAEQSEMYAELAAGAFRTAVISHIDPDAEVHAWMS